jgi:meso-butanediol dehydrogenase/(S,S)-butanediol dehydrogenase/diacetyl reductase
MASPRRVMIIGAAGTIGQATTRLLHSQGQDLVLIDQDHAALMALSQALSGIEAWTVDALDSVALAKVFEASASRGLDAVVLAVGQEGPVGLLEDCDDASFDHIMTLNVKSVWLGLKHSLKLMKAQGHGSIVILSSVSGVLGAPMLSAYAASKHAVMGLVRTAAREAASANIRVNAVCPAPVVSAMMKRIDGALIEGFPERLAGHTDATRALPMKRYGEPQEVAQAIAFLCSEASSYISGTAFMVDGAMTCR